jgi:hypothetical protein
MIKKQKNTRKKTKAWATRTSFKTNMPYQYHFLTQMIYAEACLR